MTCRNCHTATNVEDTRRSGQTVRRRRVCPHCGQKLTTYEVSARDFAALRTAKARRKHADVRETGKARTAHDDAQ